MRKYSFFGLSFFVLILFFSSLILAENQRGFEPELQTLEHEYSKKYSCYKPHDFSAWSTTGVVRGIRTTERIAALTLDACGGKGGSGFDTELIGYLEKTHTPATLFISGRWIDANPVLFKKLCSNTLFDVQNHGLMHRPLSVNGASIYGIKGTKNIPELIDEVELNAVKIAAVKGQKPRFFRSGTACYDDVAIKIVNDLGYRIINYRVSPGDAEREKTTGFLVKKLLREISPGAIVLMHMNHPERNTCEALKTALPVLKKKGYRFVKLADYEDRLIER